MMNFEEVLGASGLLNSFIGCRTTRASVLDILEAMLVNAQDVSNPQASPSRYIDAVVQSTKPEVGKLSSEQALNGEKEKARLSPKGNPAWEADKLAANSPTNDEQENPIQSQKLHNSQNRETK